MPKRRTLRLVAMMAGLVMPATSVLLAISGLNVRPVPVTTAPVPMALLVMGLALAMPVGLAMPATNVPKIRHQSHNRLQMDQALPAGGGSGFAQPLAPSAFEPHPYIRLDGGEDLGSSRCSSRLGRSEDQGAFAGVGRIASAGSQYDHRDLEAS